MLLSIILPCFNEQNIIEKTHSRLMNTIKTIDELDFEIIYIDDGSGDNTLQILKELQKADDRIKVIAFSRNFGQQMAVTAGLSHSSGDCVVLIDADLQDPPELIPEMVKKWQEGYHIVYGVRAQRTGETRLKLWTSKIFYRFINRLSDVNIPLDAGDFRLMDRCVVDILIEMPERYRFIRGMVSWTGFEQIALPFNREPRTAGKTKYSVIKMLGLAIDAVLSFSTMPLKLVFWIGYLASLMALVGIAYALIMRLFTDIWVPGWTLLFIMVLFLGGIQLISIGIIGEYIGRTYGEVKHRPLYIVKERLGFNKNLNDRLQKPNGWNK